MQAAGVGPGVNVGLHLPNTPHFVIAFFAVLMAGGRVVNFSPLAAPRELAYQIADAETKVMITLGLPMLYPQIAALKGTGKFDTLVVCSIADFLPAPVAAMFGPAAERIGGAGREIDFSTLIGNDGAYTRHLHGPIEDEVAVLQYTGGTTGQPKGAMLTHANFCAVLNIYSYWNGLGPDEPPEKALAVLPLFHIFGLTFLMLLAVANGSQLVLHIRFDPDRVLADIARKKITVFPGVPTMYTALANHPKAKEFDLSSVTMWVSGGAPLPLDVQQRFETLAGRAPREGYGLTETAPLGTLQRRDVPPRRGSVGLPAPRSLLEIVDLADDSKVLPPGERGEVCFTGPQVMKGYWKKPEATAEAFRGGRFHTGDIGYLDRGRLSHFGRPQEGHDSVRRLQRVSAQHRGSDLRASGGGRSHRHRHSRRLSRPVGQGIHRAQARSGAVRHRRPESLPRRQARQIRNADRDRNPRKPAEDAGRQIVEEGIGGGRNGQATTGRDGGGEARPEDKSWRTPSRPIFGKTRRAARSGTTSSLASRALRSPTR